MKEPTSAELRKLTQTATARIGRLLQPKEVLAQAAENARDLLDNT